MKKGDEWTAGSVETLLLDVRVTGVGGFPPVVSDDAWIKAQERLLAEMGSTAYFHRLLASLRKSFD